MTGIFITAFIIIAFFVVFFDATTRIYAETYAVNIHTAKRLVHPKTTTAMLMIIILIEILMPSGKLIEQLQMSDCQMRTYYTALATGAAPILLAYIKTARKAEKTDNQRNIALTIAAVLCTVAYTLTYVITSAI